MQSEYRFVPSLHLFCPDLTFDDWNGRLVHLKGMQKIFTWLEWQVLLYNADPYTENN